VGLIIVDLLFLHRNRDCLAYANFPLSFGSR
jgi:hypothetical protein